MTRTLVILAFLIHVSQLSQAQWTELTVGGVDVAIRALLVSGDTVYAGTEFHGLYRSTDKGVHWEAMNAGLPRENPLGNFTSVYSITQLNGTLFIGIEGGVYRSTDHGVQWTSVGNLSDYLIHILASHGTRLYAASVEGNTPASVFVSSDQGTQWQTIWSVDRDRANCLLVSEGYILIGGLSGRVYSSFDGGTTSTFTDPTGSQWTPSSTDYYSINALVSVRQGILASTSKGTYLSEDTTKTWQLIDASDIARNIIDIHQRDTVLYASVWTLPQMFLAKSTDQGKSWTPIGSSPEASWIFSFCLLDDRILINQENTVYSTTNEGLTWSESSAGLPFEFAEVDGFLSIGQKLILQTYDFSLQATEDNGENFLRLNPPVSVPFSIGGDERAIYVSGPQSIVKSTDGGDSWVDAGRASTWEGDINIYQVVVHGDNVIVESRWGVFFADINGTQWQSAGPDGTLGGTSLACFCASRPNWMWRSLTDGETWLQRPTDLDFPETGQYGELSCRATAIAGVDSSLFMGTTLGGVFESIDLGLHWDSTGLNDVAISGGVTIGGNVVFVGTENGLFMRKLHGKVWKKADFDTSVGFIQAIHAHNGYLFVSSMKEYPAGDGYNYISQHGLWRRSIADLAAMVPADPAIPPVSSEWVQLANTSQALNDLRSVGRELFAGTEQGLFALYNGNESWWRSRIGGTEYPVSVRAVAGDGSLAFAVGSGIINESRDGLVWDNGSYNLYSLLNSGSEALPVNSVVRHGENVMVEGPDTVVYYRSTAGDNWQAANARGTLGATQFAVFASKDAQSMWRSLESGATWSERSTGLSPTKVNCLTGVDSLVLMGTGAGLYQSTDLGIHWSSAGLTMPVTDLLIKNDQIFASTGDGIKMRKVVGGSWVAGGLESLSDITALEAHLGLLYVGTTSHGLWRRPLSEMSIPTTPGSLAVNVRNRSDVWPMGWTGRVRLFNSSGAQVDSALIDTATGTATLSGAASGSGYFLRAWCTPSPQTAFGEEFWGRMDNVTIEPSPSTTSLTFTCNTPFVREVRAYDLSSGQEVTGDTVFVGTTLRLTVKIVNPMQQGGTQTLYGRLILDGSRSPLYAFDSTTTVGVALPAADSATLEFHYKPQLLQPYFAAAAALIYFNGQPTVAHGQPWGATPLVTVVPGAVSVAERLSELEIPGTFMLRQNYPNPFNPSTTIRFGIPERSDVTLAVYNVLGQLVRELVKGELQAGYYEVKFDGSNLASDVYIYRMTAGDFVATKRLVLVK